METVSTHQKGYYRDQTILGLLEKLVVLDTDQIHLLACPEISYEMCCRKLRNLVKQKRIKRDRYTMNTPYFYYLDKCPKHIEHRIGVNWVYIYFYLQQTLKQLKIYSFQTEPKDYEPIIEPDAFCPVFYTLTSQNYFIEFDRAESGNPFLKIPKYDTLFLKLFNDRKNGKKSYWWIDLSREQSFAVIVVTTGNKERIQKHINNEKQYGYKVYLMTLEELKIKCEDLSKQLKEKEN